MTPASPPPPLARPPSPTPPSFKRICLFSDGSWNTPESESPTNISLLARSILPHGPSGIHQIVLYDQGVGTEGDFIDRALGGAIGAGIDLNIQQLYTFLVLNYDHGDEIYLFGFSRGSYTVRSLAGMIHRAGLLRPQYMGHIQEAYQLYRSNAEADCKVAAAFRQQRCVRRVPIKLVACFDTVGALGIPKYVPFPVSMFRNHAKYRFHDTTLSEYIENAIHIVSVDEELVPFQPTLMSANEKVGAKQLTQVYMAGRHGGVGGGNLREEPLARNALKFLLDEMERRGLKLDVDGGTLPKQFVTNHLPAGRPKRTSLFGLIGLSMGYQDRKIASADELHPTVKGMYIEMPSWRPGSLRQFKKYLDASD